MCVLCVLRVAPSVYCEIVRARLWVGYQIKNSKKSACALCETFSELGTLLHNPYKSVPLPPRYLGLTCLCP